jgi:hypothetical protein
MAGYLIGAVTATFSLWLGEVLVRRAFRPDTGKVPAISQLQLGLLAKLPLFAIVIFFTNSLGLSAVGGFLGGYVLVYFALVLGALTAKDAPVSMSDD